MCVPLYYSLLKTSLSSGSFFYLPLVLYIQKTKKKFTLNVFGNPLCNFKPFTIIISLSLLFLEQNAVLSGKMYILIQGCGSVYRLE